MTMPTTPPPSRARALRDLAAKGARQQWSADEDLDWTEDVVVPKRLPRGFYATLLSQFYYGELATLSMCGRLLDEVGDPLVRRCLRLQVADEERHARVYESYLARIGDLPPPDPALEDAFAEALAWSGPSRAMIAAFNVILESEALRALEDLAGWLPCPLFRRINARVRGDEARHFAFGRIYLQGAFGDLALDERLDIYRWLKGLWNATAFGTLDRFRIPGLITRHRRRSWAETGWDGHLESLIGIGLLGADEVRLAEGAPGGGGGR